MNFVRKHFYFIIAMDNSTVLKCHDITEPTLMVKSSRHGSPVAWVENCRNARGCFSTVDRSVESVMADYF